MPLVIPHCDQETSRFTPWSQDLSAAMCVAALASVFAGLTAYFLSGIPAGTSPTTYLGYSTVILCTCFGLWRPFAATLSAFILLAINPGYPIPHSITSAPSDYLVAAAVVSLIVRSSGRLGLPTGTKIALAAVSIAATTSLIVGITNPDLPPDKLLAAEYLGMLNMACYIIAPTAGLRSSQDIRTLWFALVLGIIPLLASGLVGWTDTLFCYSDGFNQVFTTAGFRVKGLLGDPNIFAVSVASMVPLTIPFTARLGRRWPILVSAMGGISIVLSGSRSGVISGYVASLLSVLSVSQKRAWSIAVSATLLVTLAIGSSYLWGRLPCLVGGPAERVLFQERNNQLEYFERLIGGQLEALAERPLSPAEKSAFRKLLIERYGDGFGIDRSGFRKAEGISDLLTKVPIDEARRLLWGHAVVIGIERPVFGIGISNMARITPNGWRGHNTVLTTFAEQGVFGITLIAIALCLALLAALNGIRNSTNGYLREIYVSVLIGLSVSLVGSLSQDMIRQPLIWGLLGFLMTGSRFPRAVVKM